MNIDFTKLLNLLMPTFLRSGSLQALYIAVSTPLVHEWALFRAWQTDMRMQAAVTCQVQYMEMILNYRLFGNFLRTIYITDGDGVTVDFHVNISAGITVNGQLLISLLEKYKMVGKRYSIGQSTYTYEVAWTDPVCELNAITYEYAWTDPVCELVYVETKLQNPVSVHLSGNGNVYATTPYNVASRLAIRMHVIFLNGQTYDFSALIEIGTKLSPEVDAQIPGDFISKPSSVSLVSVAPEFDATNIYSGGGLE